MRRITALFLLIALLAGLSGCAVQTQETYREPIRLYYCDLAQEHAHGGADGVLAYETIDLGEGGMTAETALSRYFEGPKSAELTAPFAPGTRCERVRLDGGVLSLRLSEEYGALSGVWLTLTNACRALSASLHTGRLPAFCGVSSSVSSVPVSSFSVSGILTSSACG